MKGIKNKDGSKTVTFNKYPSTDKITQILYTIKQVKPIGFEAPRGGAYNNRKHLKLGTPCS